MSWRDRVAAVVFGAAVGGGLVVAPATADPLVVPTYSCRLLDQNITGVTTGRENCSASDGAPSGSVRQPLRLEFPAARTVFTCKEGVVRLPDDVQGLRCVQTEGPWG
ncbi:hypothetical protein [Nocardia sp. NPDC057227]|uniref:hypothetical protein n=1 Tax=Nocardia sp. NPDC057227 TaxID=3346056 RepID=UPI003639623D